MLWFGTQELAHPVPVAKVDCVAQEELCTDANVTRYPTLFMVRHGRRYPLEVQAPTEVELAQYVAAFSGPVSRRLTTDAEVARALSSHPQAPLAIFFGPSQHEKVRGTLPVLVWVVVGVVVVVWLCAKHARVHSWQCCRCKKAWSGCFVTGSSSSHTAPGASMCLRMRRRHWLSPQGSGCRLWNQTAWVQQLCWCSSHSCDLGSSLPTKSLTWRRCVLRNGVVHRSHPLTAALCFAMLSCTSSTWTRA